ncbi:MAG TPA: DNA alkylation repair protein [Actinomycetota bacterium]|nr:DNA alkylation repair protein [Actinomycetota bacterium]
MNLDEVIRELREMADPANLAGQARFGIEVTSSLGVSMTRLRPLARRIGKDHLLAQQLWSSGIREARILATLVEDPVRVTPEQMERWAGDFSSWEVVDAACCNLFDRTAHRFDKAAEWAGRDEEFVKRAAFSLMAGIAVHDRGASDEQLAALLSLVEAEACDPRNFVRKAVSWALRQIGKRSPALNAEAIASAERIAGFDCKPARWVASDALRELRSPQVQERLRQGAQA